MPSSPAAGSAAFAHLLLMIVTLWFGLRHVFQRTPWQRAYIAIYATFAAEVAESWIIDVQHWRHFYLLIGLIWGLIAAGGLRTRRAVASAAGRSLYSAATTERSAARLAHQSGGLGVPSSNLGAPTNKIKYLGRITHASVSQKLVLGNTWETNRRPPLFPQIRFSRYGATNSIARAQYALGNQQVRGCQLVTSVTAANTTRSTLTFTSLVEGNMRKFSILGLIVVATLFTAGFIITVGNNTATADTPQVSIDTHANTLAAGQLPAVQRHYALRWHR